MIITVYEGPAKGIYKIAKFEELMDSLGAQAKGDFTKSAGDEERKLWFLKSYDSTSLTYIRKPSTIPLLTRPHIKITVMGSEKGMGEVEKIILEAAK